MRKRQLSISERMHNAVRGIGTVVLTLVTFIVVLWICIIGIRIVMGPAVAFADEVATPEDIEQGNAINLQQRSDSSFLYDTSIKDLATADSYLDGQTVQVVGEAVGDKVRASLSGDRCWVTLESENGADFISVYMTESQASQINQMGRYGVIGSSVQVKGTYHLACKEHQGLSDLHAETVQVVQPGHKEPDVFDTDRFITGIFLLMVGLFLTVFYYFLRERQR